LKYTVHFQVYQASYTLHACAHGNGSLGYSMAERIADETLSVQFIMAYLRGQRGVVGKLRRTRK